MATPVTIVLEIQELDPATRSYPLALYSEETGGVDWATKAVNEAVKEVALPADLPDETHRGWTADKACKVFAEEAGVSPEFVQIGEYLFGLLDRDEVGRVWKERLRQARRDETMRIRVVLRINARALRELPWELLYGSGEYLFTSLANPMYRGTWLETNGQREESLPLRILVVVGAGEDDPKVKALEELEALRRSIHRNPSVEMEELIRPTAQELVDFMRVFRPHIFHFIGHGEMIGASEKAVLIFQDPDGNGRFTRRDWGAEQIKRDLNAAQWCPLLVVLNACRSTLPGPRKSAEELAAIFMERGACGVIGMQGDILGGASALFARKLYECIVGGAPLDSAVAEARTAVSASFDERREWALPVLYLACPPHQVLPAAYAIPNPLDVLTEFANAFVELGDFVDRRDERRDLCFTFLNSAAGLQGQNVMVVHGAEKIGKSDLVRWCARHLSLRGRRVHYVNLEKNSGGQCPSVLKAIRNGSKGSQCAILGAFPDEPFVVFDRKLEAIIQQHPENDDPIAALCDAFGEGIRQLSASEDLLIILDHLELSAPGINGTVDSADFVTYLKPRFFDAVARGRLGKIRLLVVVRDEELRREEGQKLAGLSRTIPVPAWPQEQFMWLAKQYVLDALEMDRARVESLLDMARGSLPQRCGPESLRNVRLFIELALRNFRDDLTR